MKTLDPWPRIVFFDGICVLCNKSVDFLIKNDKKKRLKYATTQSEAADYLLSNEQLQPAIPESIIYYENGDIYVKSTAILKIFKELRQPWPVFSYLIIIPRPIRDGMYDLIARYRYRWFGKMQHCRLPDAKTREVVLD